MSTMLLYVGLSTWHVQNYLWFFSVHKVTYVYYANICRVKYVVCAKLLVGHCRRTTAHK